MLFMVHYVNGSRGYVIQQNTWIDRWGFACRYHSGEVHSAVCMSDLERPFGHFETLTKMIEDFIISGVEPFPAQRTFFTSGMINYAMESLYERKRIETTELLV
ncbi:hypothetical protein [Paenibacillus nasutitermitis]|uniref:hypothetical protein n=1 Tax=Paenibacillus nasutitermitis TaxID=1652958 RepID=UPI00166EB34E|nr:hypothetical protein [Paenibacillus nasutitermitis]